MATIINEKEIADKVVSIVVNLQNKYELPPESLAALAEAFQAGVEFWKEETERIMKETFNG